MMVFKHLDHDDKNYLTKDDLKCAMEKMNMDIVIDDIDDILEMYEEYEGKITFELFKKLMIEDI